MVHLQRFVFDEWTPRKLDMDVMVDGEYDLEKFKGTGLQSGEVEFSPSSSGGVSSGLEAKAEFVDSLMAMGFSKPKAVRACLAVKNSSLDDAMGWIFAHIEDPGLDDPLTSAELTTSTPTPSSSSSGEKEPPAEAVASLELMGFETARIKYALKQTNNDVNRAADWLMSHMDDPLPSSTPTTPKKTETKKVDSGSCVYRLVGIVTHLGKSTGMGHYVTHLLKEGKWILFNDNKVALSTDPKALRKGYLYFFRGVYLGAKRRTFARASAF